MSTNEETLGYHSPIIPGMDQEGEKLASEHVHDDTILRATEEHHQGSNPNNVSEGSLTLPAQNGKPHITLKTLSHLLDARKIGVLPR